MLKSKMINIVGITVASVVFALALSLFTMFCMDRFLGIDVPLFSAFGIGEETQVETGLEYDGYEGVVEIPDGFAWDPLDGFLDIPEEHKDHVWPTVANGFIGEPEDLPFGETVFSVRTTRSGLLYLKNANYGDYNGQGWNAAKEYAGFLYGKYSASYLTGAVMRENNYLTDTLVVTAFVDRYATPYYLSVVGENGHIQSSDVYSNGYADEDYVLSYYSDVDWHDLEPARDPEIVDFESDYRIYVYENYTYLDKTTEKKLASLVEREGLDQYETTFETIDAVAAYIKNNMTLNRAYSRDMDREANVLVAFLEKYKEGDIQHFASAATVLFRALGIPARYTTGHAVLALANVDTDILVENGHAWTEVYLDGIGWINIDVVNHVLTNPDGDEDNGNIGLRDDVDMEKVMFSVQATETDTLYLKAESKGDYNGNSWSDAVEYNVLLNGTYSASYLPGFICDSNGVRTNRVIITPAQGSGLKQYLVAYYLSNRNNDSTGQLQTSDVYSQGDHRLQYTQNYYSIGDWEYFDNPTGVYAEYESAYREFVYNNYLAIDNTTLAFMQALIASSPDLSRYGSDQRIKQVIAVAEYIKGSATYNIKYNRNMDSAENVVIAFLGQYKEGICQHYAASATMMYRAMGIPARYTVGYVAYTSAGKTVDVKAKNAHAWVEVYIDGFGWKPVEVTAGFETDPMFDVTLEPEDYVSIYNGSNRVPFKINGFEFYESQGYQITDVKYKENHSATGTYEMQIESLVIRDASQNDVTHLFDIDMSKTCQMNIIDGTLNLVLKDKTVEYTGEAIGFNDDDLDGFDEFKQKNFRIECIYDTFTELGRYEGGIQSLSIYDAYGNNVTKDFTIDIENATLTINGGALKVSYDEESNEYPGNECLWAVDTVYSLPFIVKASDDYDYEARGFSFAMDQTKRTEPGYIASSVEKLPDELWDRVYLGDYSDDNMPTKNSILSKYTTDARIIRYDVYYEGQLIEQFVCTTDSLGNPISAVYTMYERYIKSEIVYDFYDVVYDDLFVDDNALFNSDNAINLTDDIFKDDAIAIRGNVLYRSEVEYGYRVCGTIELTYDSRGAINDVVYNEYVYEDIGYDEALGEDDIETEEEWTEEPVENVEPVAPAEYNVSYNTTVISVDDFEDYLKNSMAFDVDTDEYDETNASLIIYAAHVKATLLSTAETYVYDGNEYKWDTDKFYCSVFVDGDDDDWADVINTIQTNHGRKVQQRVREDNLTTVRLAGTEEAFFDVSFYYLTDDDAFEEDCTHLIKFTGPENYGTITITPKSITLTIESISFQYGHQNLMNNEYFSEGILYTDGDLLKFDAGKSSSLIKAWNGVEAVDIEGVLIGGDTLASDTPITITHEDINVTVAGTVAQTYLEKSNGQYVKIITIDENGEEVDVTHCYSIDVVCGTVNVMQW